MWSLPPSGPTISVKPPLDRHVDVLVVFFEVERLGRELVAYLLEAADHLVQLLVGEHSRAVQRTRMRDRAGDVVRPQAPVEADGRVDPLEQRVLRLVEAPHQRLKIRRVLSGRVRRLGQTTWTSPP